MEPRTAKELLHLRDWLAKAEHLVGFGPDGYAADVLLQEAGDSLMMKIGEAANRLSRSDFDAPEGIDWNHAVANRNWLIHQYDHIDRAVTWSTLTRDLPAWRLALAGSFDQAESVMGLCRTK